MAARTFVRFVCLLLLGTQKLPIGSDLDESFAQKSRHGYVKALWASRSFIW